MYFRYRGHGVRDKIKFQQTFLHARATEKIRLPHMRPWSSKMDAELQEGYLNWNCSWWLNYLTT